MKPLLAPFLVMLLLSGAPHSARAASASATLSITVTPASSSNCPTTPPPQAAAMGFTVLAYQLCGASDHAATLSNWLTCADGSVTSTTPEWWESSNAGTTQFLCSRDIYQTTDPVSGKKVLDFHWNAHPTTSGTAQMGGVSYDGKTHHSYSLGHYAEITMRMTPVLTSFKGWPGPAFFEWHDYDYCNASSPDYGKSPLENDIIELYGGAPGNADFAFHDWGYRPAGRGIANGTMGDDHITLSNITGLPPVTFQGPTPITVDPMQIANQPECSNTYPPGFKNASWLWSNAGNTYLLSNTNNRTTGPQPQPLTANVVNEPVNWGWYHTGFFGGNLGQDTRYDPTVMHSYGLLESTDGNSYIQECAYIDNSLVQTDAGHPYNCGEWRFATETFHYNETRYFADWWGAPYLLNADQEEYVESISVWVGPKCFPVGTDQTCASTSKISPSTVYIQR